MNVKEIFEKAENGTLTLEQFEQAAKEAKANFVDVSEGNYVSKHKYEDELAAKAKEIETLNSTISNRDTDLAELRKQLDELEDGVISTTELNAAFKDLQTKYDTDMKAYKEQLSKQAYEFAVKEFANSKEFTSQAAKRDFIQSLMNENLKMKDGQIIGADDFTKGWTKDNADAFVTKKAEPKEPEVPAAGTESKPQFVSPTPGASAAKAPTLTELMKAANENPGMNITF